MYQCQTFLTCNALDSNSTELLGIQGIQFKTSAYKKLLYCKKKLYLVDIQNGFKF